MNHEFNLMLPEESPEPPIDFRVLLRMISHHRKLVSILWLLHEAKLLKPRNQLLQFRTLGLLMERTQEFGTTESIRVTASMYEPAHNSVTGTIIPILTITTLIVETWEVKLHRE